ncbi:DUF2971 domain-containing protein [Clostridium sardiniense]|uniref:DUF2971 domain-containing protein n=1 Tax=Clostridium sardiniense TaxID=29369 RepID=UPI003D33C7A8
MGNWRNKFLNFMNKEMWMNKEMKELINNNYPKSFYKYKEINDYTLDMIKEGMIWASNPDSFNDPYDCLLDFDAIEVIRGKFRKKNLVQIKEIDKESLKIITHKIEYAMEKIKKEIAIICLSEENNNILMWSHYANNHQGVCFEYDGNEVCEFSEIYPIVYIKENIDLSESLIDIDPHGIQKKIMIKSSVWEYEKEWRIILNNSEPEKSGGLIKFPKIKSIYLGCKTKEEDKEKIIALAKEKGINVYQMKMKRNQFKLEYSEINI